MFSSINPGVIKSSLSILITGFLFGCNGSAEEENDRDWVAGIYQPSSIFQDYCAVPRTGIDPFTNESYPDKQGSLFEEMMYLRSFTHETYLWYDEVPDINPANFTDIASYFELLKTTDVTNSGKPKDEFHFTDSYESFMQTSQSGVSEGYGINWSFISLYAPRNLTIAFNEENSPAALAGLRRGDRLVGVNDIDFVNTNSQSDIDAINEALFAPNEDQSYAFEFIAADGSTKTVTLEPDVVSLTPVMNAQVIQSHGKSVGYVQFNSFIAAAQDPLIAAFSQFASEEIDEFVLDLRYNGGGLIYQAAQVGYMAGGESTRNRVFGVLANNDKRSDENTEVRFGDRGIDWNTYQFTNEQLPTLDVERVVILTSNDTASASESVINGLRGVDVEVVLIGDTTRGKPYGFNPQANCDTVYYTVQFKSENEKGFGDYADGFIPTKADLITTDIGVDEYVPGCAVADDFSKSLGDPEEAMFAAALNYLETGACPVTETSAQVTPVLSSLSPFAAGLPIATPKSVYTENTIYQPVQPKAPWK